MTKAQKQRIIIQVALAIILGFTLGALGLFFGASYGGNNGTLGYEMMGRIGAYAGIIIGVGLGILLGKAIKK